MLYSRLKRRAFGIAAFAWILAPFVSEAVAPTLSTILPRGATRGTQVDVDFHGGNLGDAVDLMFHDEGISLVELTPEDKKVRAKIAIAPDCRLGTHAIRVRTKSGVSNLRLFSVGALSEMDENEEANNDPTTAPVIPINSTVNGRVTNEDADYFALDLAAGGILSAEIEAMRLGGPLFDPKLRLFGPSGHELLAEDDTPLMNQDAAFVYEVSEAGRYVISVSEASFGGGGDYYYRLHVGNFPRPMAVTPMGGPPGAEVKLTWLGDPQVREQTLTLASTAGPTQLNPLMDAAIAPTGVPFRVNELPTAIEAEPNNDAATATAGSAPGAFDGVIQEAGDVDWFKFEGTAGQVFDVRVYAREMGSPLDSVLVINNPSGSGLASNDDGAGMDSAVRVTLAESGPHTLYVTDHLSRGGATFAYRVEIAPVTPALSFSTNLGVGDYEPAGLTVHAGNRAFFLLNASRSDFDGPLNVSFEGLPQGVTADMEPIPAGQSVMPVVLTAAPDAPVSGALVKVNGQLAQEGTTITGHMKQDIVLIYGNNKVIFQTRRVEELATAVGEPAPFTIDIVQPKAPLVQNGTMNLRVVATRNEGFTAPIALRMLWLPSGVGSGTAEIPEGASEAALFLNANGGAAVGVHRIAVIGSSAGYTVSTALTPLEVSAPWVTFDVAKAESEKGRPTQFVVTVNQQRGYEGSYNAELLGLPKGVTTQPQPLTHETTQLTFPIDVAADAPTGKFEGIFVRAVLSTQGEDVLHQWGSGVLQVYDPLPPEMQQAAPPPAPEEAKPDEPERKTRFPTASNG
ncbi:MAG: hypothetical protein AMXMBFR4_17200 [Candidatus Hydrogenedentota bacterium]